MIKLRWEWKCCFEGVECFQGRGHEGGVVGLGY